MMYLFRSSALYVWGGSYCDNNYYSAFLLSIICNMIFNFIYFTPPLWRDTLEMSLSATSSTRLALHATYVYILEIIKIIMSRFDISFMPRRPSG